MTADKEEFDRAVYVRYQAYLLRLWQESTHTPWRLSLQNARTGEKHGFADLEALCAFLRDQTTFQPDDHKEEVD